jgi:hypothetical protein
VAFAAPVPAPKAPDFSELKAESLRKWSGAEVLVLAKFEKAVAGPVGLSDPPLRTFRLQLAITKVIRGSAKLEKTLAAHYAVRQQAIPVFPAPEQDAIVALKFVRGAWEVQGYEEESKDALAQAALATSFPIGWTIKDGKLVSPWSALGKPAKPVGSACSVSGRPVWLVGEGIKYQVEPVPSKTPMKFGNPDGDGEYTITLTNETDKEIEVPALRTNGKEILWKESMVIRCQDKNYPVPGAKNIYGDTQAAVLKPGESVKGVVNALSLTGPEWPKGGYRIEFQICLGEKSVTQSFYYLSKHHDPIRDASQKAAAE